MNVVAGALNLALGAVYIGIATLIAIDLEKEIRRRGYSHFGVAWLTIMFTCGAHHLVHGIHLAAEGRMIGGADTWAVLAGLPAGLVWSLLRIEGVRGGRGDRYIKGTPGWLSGLGAAYGVGGAATVVYSVMLLADGATFDPRLLPNVLLVLLYAGIGIGLWRGQQRNRETLGGWSTSGLALMMIFPTCAVMHGIYVLYSATGSFSPDFHGLWADWLSVPAALYFFWVVSGLETGTVKDWNEKFEAIEDLGHASSEPEALGVSA